MSRNDYFFVFFKNFYLFILAVLRLSCGMQDLSRHVQDLLAAACMWDLVP